MFDNPRHVFWQAFIAAIAIFGFGIWMGFLLENYKTSQIEMAFSKSEIDMLDIRLQSEIYKNHEINCDIAARENIDFGNRIYEEAKNLDRQEKAAKLTDNLIYQHKKYDILRTIFWLNSIYIKDKCNSSYHNVVYLYQYNNPGLDKKAEQGVISDILMRIREKYGNEIMLIPIAADNNITSIKLLADYYNITYLPSVLIDEKIKVESMKTLEEMDKLLQSA